MFLQPPKHPEVPGLSAREVLDIRLRVRNPDDWGVGEQTEMMDYPKNQSKQRGPEYFWSSILPPRASTRNKLLLEEFLFSEAGMLF